MRFLADMGVSTRSVKWLRDNGHDIIHLSEVGLHRLPYRMKRFSGKLWKSKE